MKNILVSVNTTEELRAAVVLPQIMRTFVPPQFTSCSGSIKNTVKILSQLNVFVVGGGLLRTHCVPRVRVGTERRDLQRTSPHSRKSGPCVPFRFAD